MSKYYSEDEESDKRWARRVLHAMYNLAASTPPRKSDTTSINFAHIEQNSANTCQGTFNGNSSVHVQEDKNRVSLTARVSDMFKYMENNKRYTSLVYTNALNDEVFFYSADDVIDHYDHIEKINSADLRFSTKERVLEVVPVEVRDESSHIVDVEITEDDDWLARLDILIDQNEVGCRDSRPIEEFVVGRIDYEEDEDEAVVAQIAPSTSLTSKNDEDMNLESAIDEVEESEYLESVKDDYLEIQSQGSQLVMATGHPLTPHTPIDHMKRVEVIPLLVGGARGRRKKGKPGRKKRMGRKRRPFGLSGGSGLVPNIRPKREFFRYVTNISTNSAGKFALYGAMNSPAQAINGTGFYDRAQAIALLYDLYKPLTLKAEMILQAPIIAATGRIGWSLDPDSYVSTNPSYDILEDTAYFQERIPRGKVKFHIRHRPFLLSEGTYVPNGADPVESVILEKGWYDFQTPPTEGTWFLQGDNLPPSSVVGTLILTMQVLVKQGRTLSSAMKRHKPVSSIETPEIDSEPTSEDEDPPVKRKITDDKRVFTVKTKIKDKS